jgi:hypothetical protein
MALLWCCSTKRVWKGASYCPLSSLLTTTTVIHSRNPIINSRLVVTTCCPELRSCCQAALRVTFTCKRVHTAEKSVKSACWFHPFQDRRWPDATPPATIPSAFVTLSFDVHPSITPPALCLSTTITRRPSLTVASLYKAAGCSVNRKLTVHPKHPPLSTKALRNSVSASTSHPPYTRPPNRTTSRT